jgi:predicted RNase H-like HicB family nuclease
MIRSIVVKVAHDPEAGVWFVEHRDIFGLNAEAETLEELVKKLPAVIADLVEPEEAGDTEVPVEIVVHVSTRVQLSSNAA